ncbi:unnamed protein product [Clonostachys rosea]|uniref:Uncharacterized protein n=1 Tax=Bionectria ochroleuca TaxID=29856 RepID=A0ABY6U166_BIOOC|nr:unnamed protein product [Clonostachys rosea]
MPELSFQFDPESAPSYADEVVSLLKSTLPPDSSQSPSDAAKAIDSLCNKKYEEVGEVSGFLWAFWDFFHDLARQVPYDSEEQRRFAAIVKALHDLPPRTVKLGDSWGEDSTTQLWKDLPLFGVTYREKTDADLEASGEVAKLERDVNLQWYAAQVAGLCDLYFEMYAIWALADALEGTMTEIRGAPNVVNGDPSVVKDIAYKTRSAAGWMIYTARQLHGRDEDVEGATAGPLWKPSKQEARELQRSLQKKRVYGLSPQRWSLWKQRFGCIRDCDKLDQETREYAGRAFRAMEEVEQKN